VKIQYEELNLRKVTRDMLAAANVIIESYQAQGLKLTLRQLYYQFVQRGWLPNTDKNYDKLVDAIGKGRNAGLIDWDAIVDRLRPRKKRAEWSTPALAVEAIAEQYRSDIWRDQPTRCEVWVEKDALSDIVESVCYPLGVSYVVCRGYISQTAIWKAAQRFLREWIDHEQRTVVLYLGDHDPSGLDMPRDIQKRLNLYAKRMFSTGLGPSFTHVAPVMVESIALTMAQIEEYEPPPNPAKMSDSRASDYVAEHGYESWELDALEPTVLSSVIEDAVWATLEDPAKLERNIETERKERVQLNEASTQWDRVSKLLTESQKPKAKRKKKGK